MPRTGPVALAAALAALWMGTMPDRLPAQQPVAPTPSTPSPFQTLTAADEGITAGTARPAETLTRALELGARSGEGGGAEPIETDRDSFTPATVTAGRGRLIVEAAYSFIDARVFKDSHSFPEAILRYGLTERLELRLGWNAEIGGGGNSVSGSDAGGSEGDVARGGGMEREYNLAYGVKVRITDQDRWLPRSVAIVQGFTPTGGNSTASRLVATYAAGWVFPNRWQFDAALRYGLASEEGDHFNLWAPSAVLRVPLGEKLAAHAEYFGTTSTGRERNTTQHYVSPGVRYLVTPDLELGVRVGWGLNDQSARFFANAGVGWQY